MDANVAGRCKLGNCLLTCSTWELKCDDMSVFVSVWRGFKSLRFWFGQQNFGQCRVEQNSLTTTTDTTSTHNLSSEAARQARLPLYWELSCLTVSVHLLPYFSDSHQISSHFVLYFLIHIFKHIYRRGWIYHKYYNDNKVITSVDDRTEVIVI